MTKTEKTAATTEHTVCARSKRVTGLARLSVASVLCFSAVPDAIAAWSYYTVDGDDYRAEVTSGVAAIEKDAGAGYADWITLGPVSKPPLMPYAGDPEAITGMVSKWGWLLISDRYTVYKASHTSNTGSWDIGRRVWNLGDDGKVIDSMVKNGSDQVIVNWVDADDDTVTGAITLALSDIKWPTCDGTVPDYYVDNNLVSGTSFYYRPGGLDPDLNTAIELIPGTLPIIISVPHGGAQEPSEIPIYDYGLTTDAQSLTASLLLADEIYQITGERPHVVINNVRRNRLNLNRAAASDNPDADAQTLWTGYHLFAEEARNYVTDVCGKGLFIDMHTNGAAHDKNMLAVGFGRSDIEDLFDGSYDRSLFTAKATIRNVLNQTLMAVDNINIGPTLSFGDLANRTSTHTIPTSTLDPMPAGTFFNGGFNIREHGSLNGGSVDAIQVENHWRYINNGVQKREDYIEDDLAPAVVRWLEHYYGFKLR
ncbi:hypothetical protein [Woeseia oceani]|nr:hypothetical protein [Woeseia oceani]